MKLFSLNSEVYGYLSCQFVYVYSFALIFRLAIFLSLTMANSELQMPLIARWKLASTLRANDC